MLVESGKQGKAAGGSQEQDITFNYAQGVVVDGLTHSCFVADLCVIRKISFSDVC